MRFIPLVLALTCASPAFAKVPCGGSFSSFVNNAKAEAVRMGHDKSTVNAFFANAKHSPAVIKADRSQGVFKKNFHRIFPRRYQSKPDKQWRVLWRKIQIRFQ